MTTASSRTEAIESEDAMRALGQEIGASISPGTTVALDGELGAGKTRFVAGLAAGLGLEPDAVSSPTFSLVQEHRDGRDGMALAHMDAWRLGGEDELESIGFDELVEDDATVVAIEWASRIADRLPAERISITIEITGETTRSVRIVDSTGRLQSAARHDAEGRCRTCGAPIATEHAPFCSDRCRLADLHHWFAGSYRVERPIEEDDLFDES